MLALRYVYVLALAVWLGGMVVLGAIVAPTTFQLLEASLGGGGPAAAADVFAATLARFHYVAYTCGALLLVTLALMAILGPRPAGFAIRLSVAALMLGVALYSGVAVLGEIAEIQRQVGTIPSRLPLGDLRRVRFDALHQLSTHLMMVDVAGALVLLYWEAREHGR